MLCYGTSNDHLDISLSLLFPWDGLSSGVRTSSSASCIQGWQGLCISVQASDMDIKRVLHGLGVLSQRPVQGIVAQKESFHPGTQERICGEGDAWTVLKVERGLLLLLEPCCLPVPCQWKVGPSSKMQCLWVARVGQWAVHGKGWAGTESYMTLEEWEATEGI